MKKFVIYTAIFGWPARFNYPNISIKRIDKICYTNFNIKNGCCQMIPVKGGLYQKNNFYDMRIISRNCMKAVMQQRFMKIIIPDEIFDNYEYSVYVDCKYRYSVDFKYLLSCMKSNSDIVTRKHRRRSCAYDEGEFCIKRKKDKESTISEQLDFYRNENFPTHNGLHASGLLMRRHTERLKEFSKLWWEQLVRFSHRDQISLPYVAWKYGMKISLYERQK